MKIAKKKTNVNTVQSQNILKKRDFAYWGHVKKVPINFSFNYFKNTIKYFNRNKEK